MCSFYSQKKNYFSVLDTKPKLAAMVALNKTLQETKDLPGTLYSIRQAFIKMKANKNDE